MRTQHQPNAAMKRILTAALAILLFSGCDPEYEEHVREQKSLDISRAVDKSRSECLRNGGVFKSNFNFNMHSVFSSASVSGECVFSPKDQPINQK